MSRAIFLAMGFLSLSSCVVREKKAYRGSLDVSQAVDTAAIQSYRVLKVKFLIKNSDFQPFVNPIKRALMNQVPRGTHFTVIRFPGEGRTPASDPPAPTLLLLPAGRNEGGFLAGYKKGLVLKAGLYGPSGKLIGKAEILATSTDDSTSVGSFRVQAKVSGYRSEENVVADRTALHVVDFLNGEH